MNTKNLNILLLLSIYISIVHARLPDFLKGKKCPRKKPEPCILKAIENVRPLLKKGIKDINFPRLEPFKLKVLDLDAEIPDFIIHGEASNIVAHGAGDFIIKKIKVDVENSETELEILIPHLKVTADYDTVGSRVTNVDIAGSGQFKGEFTDVIAAVKTKGHIKKVQGLQYVKLDEVNVKINTGKNPVVKIIPDEKGVAETVTAKWLESNAEGILKKMDEFMTKAANPLVMAQVNRIFNVIPLDDLFT